MEVSQPAAFFTHTLCPPVPMPVKAPLYGAYVPLSTLYSSPAVCYVTAIVPVGVVHVGSFTVFFLMIRRPPRSTLDRSSAASDVYKRQHTLCPPVPMPVKAPLY